MTNYEIIYSAQEAEKNLYVCVVEGLFYPYTIIETRWDKGFTYEVDNFIGESTKRLSIDDVIEFLMSNEDLKTDVIWKLKMI